MEVLDDILDPSRADVRIESGVARAEFAHRAANRAVAEQWAAIAEILDDARLAPHVFVDPELPMSPNERIQFAVRAAAADLAVRLSLSEVMVRGHAFDADTLRTRLPRVWGAFRAGDVSPHNARTAADLVRSLPDAVEPTDQFDEALAGIVDFAPGRFRMRARVLRERIHSIPLVERVMAAAETRGVWIDNDVDGMAYLSMKLPAEIAHSAFARIDAMARSHARVKGESHTLAQLRADVVGDLLTCADAGNSREPRVSIAVTVPVLTLLGNSDEPAILEGYGPIDAETARRLAAHAPSFTRLLTHPVSGALIDVDRNTYRPPADLKRWLEVTDVTCRFPGCLRRARASDIDHVVDHQFGGRTRASNLVHLCRHHHRIKHQTRWKVQTTARTEEPDTDHRVEWTSPTGHRRADDPPPF